MTTPNEQPSPTIRDLYPHYTEEQLAEAEHNLERYLTLVLRIFERLELEKAAQLTEHEGTLSSEVSPPTSS